MKGTDELLDIGSTDGAVPALRLNVDGVESQTVLADNTVDPFVPGLADSAPGFNPVAAIAHLEEELDDQVLKEPVRTGFHPRQELGGQLRAYPLISLFKQFLRSLVSRLRRRRHGL